MSNIELLCLIEDDPIATVLAKSFIALTNRVDNVIVFQNGKEAYEGLLSLYNKNEDLPQVIILDINMPIWSGWEFLEAFRNINTEQKIEFFILTSSLTPDDSEKARKFGLENRYLEKPLNLDRLNKVFSIVNV